MKKIIISINDLFSFGRMDANRKSGLESRLLILKMSVLCSNTNTTVSFSSAASLEEATLISYWIKSTIIPLFLTTFRPRSLAMLFYHFFFLKIKPSQVHLKWRVWFKKISDMKTNKCLRNGGVSFAGTVSESEDLLIVSFVKVNEDK